MATQVQWRGGSTSEHSTFTGAAREVTVDTQKKTLVVHDGSTAGGEPLLREDGSNSALNLGTDATPALKFAGDPDTGIYSPGADQVAISTNGTGKLFVNSSGNVGITSSAYLGFNGPSDASHSIGYDSGIDGAYIRGQSGIKFATSAGSGNERLRITSTGELKHIGGGSEGSPGVYFAGSAPSNSLYVQATTGNVGLGTGSVDDSTDSSTRLQVQATNAGSDVALRIKNNSTTANTSSSIRFTNSTSTFDHGSIVVGRSPTAYLALQTNDGNTALYIDSSQRVGIGTTDPSCLLELAKDGTNGAQIDLKTTDSTTAASRIRGVGSDGFSDGEIRFANNGISFQTGAGGAGEKASINSSGKFIVKGVGTEAFSVDGGAPNNSLIVDSSGRCLVGTPTDQTGNFSTSKLQLQGPTNSYAGLDFIRDDSEVVTDDVLGRIRFWSTDGNTQQGAWISAEADGAHATDDKPTRLVFSTAASGQSSPDPRMTIDSTGRILTADAVGKTFATSTKQFVGSPDGSASANTGNVSMESHATSTSTRHHISFVNPNGVVGSISTNASATTYNTSSDYRLKENVVPLTGAANRVNQLQVHRFNFIADPDITVDGFIAHEVQAVVPECVTGTKDEVDDEGNPAYQGIDQSKLVPLLTAALQEALAEIESLKARLDAANL